ncbi:hypothetical protein AOX55_00005166 (plasmid) [Sinorhizobium fredii CCBAU 25509]|nr:hypothetical protein AOX55_00005166 [Sinorhizobium fredii CCBAU 25509]
MDRTITFKYSTSFRRKGRIWDIIPENKNATAVHQNEFPS